MKAFTDLEQSKKLAEILPIESADMAWCNSSIKGINYTDPWHVELKTPIEIESIFNEAFVSDWKTWWRIIPCWSLALLDILPHRIDDRYDLVLGKLPDNKGWYVCYDDIDHFLKHYVTNSNLIDACYEMIIKLYEQKLI